MINLPQGLDTRATLSDAEFRVASLVAQGLKNTEIAAQLSITEKTVKWHVTSINRKLKTRNCVEIALKVLQQ